MAPADPTGPLSLPPPPQPDDAARFLRDLFWDGVVFGGISGTCGVLVGHPFDTIKLRMQMAAAPAAGAAPAPGVAAALRAVVRAEGLRGLFKGAFSISLGQAPINAMIFGANHFATELLLGRQGGAPLSLAQTFGCGTFSGLMQSLVLAPFELLKVQQQMHGVGRRGEALAFSAAARAVVERFGVAGLYRGMAATLVRGFAGRGARPRFFFSLFAALTPR